MSASKQMRQLASHSFRSGRFVALFWADKQFTRPGLWVWTGKRHVHLPSLKGDRA